MRPYILLIMILLALPSIVLSQKNDEDPKIMVNSKSVSGVESNSSLQFHLSSGITKPSAPSVFKEYFKNGFNFSGKFSINSHRQTSFFITFDYHYLSFDTKGQDGLKGGNSNMFFGSGEFKYKFLSHKFYKKKFLPFVKIGVGGVIISQGDLSGPEISTIEYEPKTKSFMRLGAGLELNKFFLDVSHIRIIEGTSKQSDNSFRWEDIDLVMNQISIGIKL